MNRIFGSGMLLIAVAALSPQMPAQQAAAENSNVEPAATDALNRMGAYLRSLKAFEVNGEGTTEVVLIDGLKVQHNRKTNLLARFPDRLRAQIDSDDGSKFYLFDGKSFTLFARDEGYYATVAAPDTVGKLADQLEKYDIQVPLVDLFLWGRPGNTPPKLTAALDIGPSSIEGITCEQYAFRQEGLDWQIWIQLGEYPLPLKMVLTTTTDEARPQHSMTLSWNLAPSFNESAFVFDPPAGTNKIVFAGGESR